MRQSGRFPPCFPIRRPARSGFCEKPSYENCRSDLANTGIYVIAPEVVKLIPDGKMWDFAKDVFPLMLKKGLPLGYYEEKGYWCDIGDIRAYKRCCADMLAGRIALSPAQAEIKNTDDGGKCFISGTALISPDAVISGNTVIGRGVYISSGAKLRGAIVMNGAFIGEDTTLNDCIICSDAKICSGSAVYENAVVGEGSVIGENTVISSGIRIWQNKQIAKGSFVTGDVKYGSVSSPDFSEDGIHGATNTVITPEYAGRTGCAAAEISSGRIAVACGEGSAARALKSSVLSGIASTGKTGFDCGEIPLPVLSYVSGLLGCDIMLHISANEQTRILIYSQGMMPLTRSQERIFENALKRGEFMNAGWEDFGETRIFNGAPALYEALLYKNSRFTLPYDIAIMCRSEELKRICQPFAKSIGTGREKLVITLNERGTSAEISCGTTKIDADSMKLIACRLNSARGHDTALPNDFPHTAELVAQQYGGSIIRYYASSMDNRDRQARELAAKQRINTDGFLLTLKVLLFLYEQGCSPKEALAMLPRSSTEKRFIRISCPPQRLFGRVGAVPEENEGAVISDEDKRVFMRPDKRGTGLYLYAESFGTETASSLCDKAEKLLRDAMDKK